MTNNDLTRALEEIPALAPTPKEHFELEKHLHVLASSVEGQVWNVQAIIAQEVYMRGESGTFYEQVALYQMGWKEVAALKRAFKTDLEKFNVCHFEIFPVGSEPAELAPSLGQESYFMTPDPMSFAAACLSMVM